MIKKVWKSYFYDNFRLSRLQVWSLGNLSNLISKSYLNTVFENLRLQ